jgi:hypothetical protein
VGLAVSGRFGKLGFGNAGKRGSATPTSLGAPIAGSYIYTVANLILRKASYSFFYYKSDSKNTTTTSFIVPLLL